MAEGETQCLRCGQSVSELRRKIINERMTLRGMDALGIGVGAITATALILPPLWIQHAFAIPKDSWINGLMMLVFIGGFCLIPLASQLVCRPSRRRLASLYTQLDRQIN